MNEKIIVIKDLSKDFPSGSETLNILKSLDLEIKKGDSVAISGESGSGKSTLLNIIGGLDRTGRSLCVRVPARLDSLGEKALNEYRSRFVGFVFQFHYLLKDFTALENVMLPAYVAGTPKKKALGRARSLLDDVKLLSRASHFPSQLSGGERQRIAVARALVNQSEILLADEPTGNLDPANSAIVTELLFSCAERYGKTTRCARLPMMQS
ncbi:ABC transporter ATP-binding protein [Treponema sp.]